MKKDTEIWLLYADDNLKSTRVLLDSKLYNPCLQNAQQAVEKYLKALLIENAAGLLKTHSIRELATLLEERNVYLSITEDEIDLLDSVYLPTKYPAFSVLPHFAPDHALCEQCLNIAERVRDDVSRETKKI